MMITSPQKRGAKCCDKYVCLSVCLTDHSRLENYTADLHQIYVHVTCGRFSSDCIAIS